MLNLLGTIGGNVLSFPGIFGLGLGMTTRSWPLACALGGLMGVFEAAFFVGFNLAGITMFDLAIAIAVGVLAGSLGCAIRHKGATI
jgi:hypothetical protein